MSSKYIYHNSKNTDPEIEITFQKLEKENTIGCLIFSIVMLSLLFIFLTILPFLLTVIEFLIIILACITIYKVYLERHVLNFIQKHHLRH